MTIKKNAKGMAVVVLAMAFFVGGLAAFAPNAKALDSANASADLVVGQPDMTSSSGNQGNASSSANTVYWPNGTWTDGKKLIVADMQNSRVLIFNSIPTGNNASADVVIGQVDMNHDEANQGNSSPAANTLFNPYTVSSDGTRLFIADMGNQRVLIFNSIPTVNNASADVVIGQADMTHNTIHLDATADTLDYPYCVHADGTKLYIADGRNHRILIYNTIPTTDGASANVVVGQPDMTHGEANRGGSVAANTLDTPSGVFTWGGKMYVNDAYNNRVLIFNSIPTENNASADVAVGQANLTSVSNDGIDPGTAQNSLYFPYHAFTDGTRLYVSDYGNSRVLIWNSIPTASGASADTVIGQQNFTSNSANQGGSAAASTLENPNGIFFNGKKLFIADQYNNRVLIYNSIPTANNASADVIIGQQNATGESANQGGAVEANTLNGPTQVFSYGPKLLVVDGMNNRVLIFNSIPTANNTSADIVIGQQNMTSNTVCQIGCWDGIGASTLVYPRGAIVANQKLIVGDYTSNRVLIYNSFGSQWVINKNKSRTLSGDEKIKVKKKKIEFTGKKTAWKKGRVRVYRDGALVKNVKIGGNGKWKAGFKDTGSAVKDFVIKYYDKSGVLQMNSETYALGINRGSLVEATLKKATFSGTMDEKPEKQEKGKQDWEIPDLAD